MSGAEELIVASTQFDKEVIKQEKKTKENIDFFKDKFLAGGIEQKAKEKVDIQELINKRAK